MRGRSTTFRSGNGNLVQVINIGVNDDHPMADHNSPQQQSAGGARLNNINVGGFSMPPPQFVVVNNGQGEQQ